MLGLLARQEDNPSLEKALQVFISYSRKDGLIADRVVGGLTRRSIDVMIDTRELLAGDDWRDELEKMIQSADTVIWLVSKHSIGSTEVQWELETLQSLNKRLVPVRIDDIEVDELPPTINKLHLLSLLPSEDVEAQLDSLANTLKVPKAWVQTHTWLGEQARRNVKLRGELLKDAEHWLLEKPEEAEPPTQDILDYIADNRRKTNLKRSLAVASTICSVAVIAWLLKWYDDTQKIAQSRTLAVTSERATDRGNAGLGVNLALEALPDPDEDRGRPVIIEPQQALYKALVSLRERTVFKGHDAALTYVEMGPDGERVVTASTDGRAGLWTMDGRLSQWLEGHKKAVSMAKFSPDGSRIMTISDDRTGILWNRDGKRLATLAGHTQPVLFAEFSHDGRHIITTSADYTARLWSALDGEPIKGFKGHQAKITAAAFSPDDRLLATVSVDQTVRIWSIEETSKPVVLEGHGDRVLDVDFSPDGDLVATASRDGEAVLWPLNGDAEISLQGHEGVVNSVRFSSDGSLIVTASDDNTAKIWMANDGEEVTTLRGHKARVIHAEFSGDRSKVLTASIDGAIGLWRIAETGENEKGFEADLHTMLRGHVRSIVSAGFSADGQAIITAGKDKTARLWDAGDEPPFSKALRHNCNVRSLAFSRDGSRIVSACKDGYVTLWDAETLAPLNEGEIGELIISTGLSVDGQRLALAHEDGTATIWNTDTLQELGRVRGHGARVRSVAFNGDGTRLLTSSADGTAKIWNVLTQEEILALVGHEGRVRTAEFSPDNRRVLTVSEDQTAKIWDSLTGALIQTFKDHEADVWAAGFSPDGTKIVTGSVNGQIFMTDLAKPERGRPLIGHGDNIRSAEFSPDGRYILTSSWDRTVKLWDVNMAKAVASMPNEDIILDATFDPKGGRIAHLIGDKVRLRPIYPSVEALIDAAKSVRPHNHIYQGR